MYLPVDWPVPDLVALRARTAPDRPALIVAETGQSWTYRDLSDGPVDALAGGLHGVDVSPGDHVGALVPPGVGMAQLVHAVARAGAVFVPLPPDAPPAVVTARCGAADVAVLVCTPETEPVAVRAFDGPVASVGEPRHRRVESLRDHHSGLPPGATWAPSDVQWLVFTSGTVGEPRAVELTARNLIASATASAFRLGVRPADRWLACLPTHHVGGLAPMVRSALYGTAVVAQSGFDVGATAAAMVDHGATGVSLVPTMLTRLLDAGWSAPSSLRFVLLGGAPASPRLVDRWLAADVPVHPTYGTTETASQVATARPAEVTAHPGTVGRPLRGIEVAVLDGDDEPCPPMAAGELVVSGPVVTPGYYGDETASARRLDEAGFRTGDRGYRDGDGRVWVLGRIDDAIVTGGETVHPSEVEDVLRTYPDVDDASVVGLDDPEWGQVVAALVTGPGAADGPPAGLRVHCRDRLAPPAVPKVVASAAELPRTASGTVDRAAVRERLRDGRRVGDL